MTIVLVICVSFAVAIVAASFFEWALHRFVMHGTLIKAYPYQAHDRVHHVIFDSGPNYHLKEQHNEHLVTMAWWNGPVLLLLNAPLPILVAWLVGSWWVILGAMLGFTTYYCVYEYIHYCMHVPGPRWFQKTNMFKWIDQHHRLHHLDPMTNLNVVLPIADFILRTRINRAPMA